MSDMGGNKKNPGPKNQTFTKQKNLQRSRGSVPASKGTAGDDEQFNKGASYNDDDGTGEKGNVDSHPGDASQVGGDGMQDEQFDNKSTHFKNRGKLGSKSSGGTPGNFDSSMPSPAQQIMRAVAKAAQGPGPDQEYQGNSKVSSPKSKSQSKSFSDTTPDNEQAKPKTSKTQSFTAKAPESKKGSKT